MAVEYCGAVPKSWCGVVLGSVVPQVIVECVDESCQSERQKFHCCASYGL